MACPQVLRDLFRMFDLSIDNQKAVFGQKAGEPAEGGADLCDVLKEIHMVFFDIQNNTYGWIKGQIAVGVFTGLC